jgi:hypothetical protein
MNKLNISTKVSEKEEEEMKKLDEKFQKEEEIVAVVSRDL